jgi:hypothetical protein
MSENTIVNRVASSPLVTLDSADYLDPHERVLYDLKDNLFQEMILREKDFRTFIKGHDFAKYQNKHVALTCTTDAIVPTWAYMLLTVKMEPHARTVTFGDLRDLELILLKEALQKIDLESLRGRPVVIKGCSELSHPEFAFVELSRLLRPVVKTLMYGEPCSTVPIYRRAG